MIWRFLDTGEQDGPQNMATDEVLLRQCRAGISAPALRVYRWKPWTISVGRMEDVDRCVDTAACERDGIPIVRRPTGGRAVYHAEELTYSFVARLEDLPVAPAVGDTYRFIAEALVGALVALGIPAEIWRPGQAAKRSARSVAGGRPPGRGPCFASVSQYEICVGGRKLVGSAQRRWPDAILQHGSILLGPAHCEIERYLRKNRSPEAGSLASRTTTVAEVLDRRVGPRELSLRLLDAARQTWGVEMREGSLQPEERAQGVELRGGKYATRQWNLDSGRRIREGGERRGVPAVRIGPDRNPGDEH